MPEHSPTDRLRLAGLDPDLPPVREALTADGAAARFCPYTGRELVMVLPGGATVVVGDDPFTSAGGVVRYRPSGVGELIDNPTSLRAYRGCLDLRLSCGTPLPDGALKRDAPPDATLTRELQLMPAGMGKVASVAVRHGRCYSLLSYPRNNHAVQSWTLPDGLVPAGWRPARFADELVPRQGFEMGSELRVAEALVYVNARSALVGWHAGTGAHRVQWTWPVGRGLPLVRIADDRMLLLQPTGDGHRAAVYDLDEVAGGPCQPLPQQVAELPGPAAGQPQPVWAEPAGDRFVVLASDARVMVFPFDGPPFEAFPNVEGVRLQPPTLRPGDAGPELLAFATGLTAAETERNWLLTVPLTAGQPYRFVETFEPDVASATFSPCVVDNRLLQVKVDGPNNMVISSSEPGDPSRRAAEAPLVATQGGQLYGMTTAVCHDRELLVAVCAQSSRRVVVRDGALQPVPVDPSLPSAPTGNDVRIFWDSAGLYVCDLTAGVMYLGRPQ